MQPNYAPLSLSSSCKTACVRDSRDVVSRPAELVVSVTVNAGFVVGPAVVGTGVVGTAVVGTGVVGSGVVGTGVVVFVIVGPVVVETGAVLFPH